MGVAPAKEAALYLTVVVLIMLGAAWSLLDLVLAGQILPGDPPTP